MAVDDTSNSECFDCKFLASLQLRRDKHGRGALCSSCKRARDEAGVAERIRRAQVLEEAGCTPAQVLAIVLGRAARA